MDGRSAAAGRNQLRAVRAESQALGNDLVRIFESGKILTS